MVIHSDGNMFIWMHNVGRSFDVSLGPNDSDVLPTTVRIVFSCLSRCGLLWSKSHQFDFEFRILIFEFLSSFGACWSARRKSEFSGDTFCYFSLAICASVQQRCKDLNQTVLAKRPKSKRFKLKRFEPKRCYKNEDVPSEIDRKLRSAIDLVSR